MSRTVVEHLEDCQEVTGGKAMVVCMSRWICIDLYRELVRLRPEWRDEHDKRGALKVVMTGKASDQPVWQPYIRNKPRREALAKRPRDPADPLRTPLVRDMWLTGFDAPSLHTMYVDKPVRGHGLMQAIARVNRAFRDKPGGLVVDYLGLAHKLKRTLVTYTENCDWGERRWTRRRRCGRWWRSAKLVETVRNNVITAWTLRENVRTNLRRLVKRVLRKHGYPPDKQESATRTVLEQAEALSVRWVA